MYSFHTSIIILCMVITGAGRSVGVKLFYQMGYSNPLFIAALYLFGQSLSLLVYWLTKYCSKKPSPENKYEPVGNEEDGTLVDDFNSVDAVSSQGCAGEGAPPAEDARVASPGRSRSPLKRQGSDRGLTEESRAAVSWAHGIPWHLKPAMAGAFNLANAALRWASYIYVPASVAEMLIAGSELILSVVAARLVRRRLVSRNRWTGVVAVSAGVLLIGFSHTFEQHYHHHYRSGSSSSSSGSHGGGTEAATAALPSHHTIGNLLILGQSLTSVAQDITEEIFLQEAEFPATLLLGMEGLYGLVIGGLIYFIAPKSGHEDVIAETLRGDGAHFLIAISTGLVLWFAMTGIFNIQVTGATSSMTRNVWKNSRTLLVWVIGLIIYYSSSDTNNNNNNHTTTTNVLGEPWLTPDSYIILIGYLLMLSGIVLYYR